MQLLFKIWSFLFFLSGFCKKHVAELFTYYNPEKIVAPVYVFELNSFYKVWLYLFGTRDDENALFKSVCDIQRVEYIRINFNMPLNFFFAEHLAQPFDYWGWYNEIIVEFRKISFESDMDGVVTLALLHTYIERAQFVQFWYPLRKSGQILTLRLSTDFDNIYSPFFLSIRYVHVYYDTLATTDCKTIEYFPFYVNVQKETFYTSHVYPNYGGIDRFEKGLMYTKYDEVIKKYNTFFKKKPGFKNFGLYNLKPLYNFYTFFKLNFVKVNAEFFKNQRKLYNIKFKPTDVSLYLGLQKLKRTTTLFIRKNKMFNKGRYSRNRQLYRTGVYWCIWLNIICVFGLYYYFYRFVFNFGYVYLPMLLFILSIFGSRLVKYRLYNPEVMVGEIIAFGQIVTSYFADFLKKVWFFLKESAIRLVKFLWRLILLIRY